MKLKELCSALAEYTICVGGDPAISGAQPTTTRPCLITPVPEQHFWQLFGVHIHLDVIVPVLLHGHWPPFSAESLFHGSSELLQDGC
jgi:hypothetical protein